jgi:hypothetical protein
MARWLVRLLTAAWALFWLWFGVASGIHEGLPWQGVTLHAVRPGLILVVIALIAWFWPRPGGVLLVVTAFVLAAWYGIYFGHMPTSAKLFVLSTLALPPLLGGLILLWPGINRPGSQ